MELHYSMKPVDVKRWRQNVVKPKIGTRGAAECVTAVLTTFWRPLWSITRDERQQKPHKFAYLTMKNCICARFARAVFIFWHFEDVLVLSTTWNDLFCSCVDDVSIWWQMLIFVFLCPKCWFQYNSRIVRTHFSSMMTLNIWKYCRNAKLHFHMTFSVPSTSCLLKLPTEKTHGNIESVSYTHLTLPTKA